MLALPVLTETGELLDPVTSAAREPEGHSWRGCGPTEVPDAHCVSRVEDRLAVWALHAVRRGLTLAQWPHVKTAC